ncbi:MAG: type II secretion system protein GspG [Pseudomonadota bacterium]
MERTEHNSTTGLEFGGHDASWAPPCLRRRQSRPGAAAAREAGMTLIEITIVLAIIALVMGFLVGPQVMKNFNNARVKTAAIEAKFLAFEAYARWSSDHEDESCPGSIDDLKSYSNKKVLKDPWGTKYSMVCGSNAPEGTDFGVVSAGPDKKEGTKDDIRSWD